MSAPRSYDAIVIGGGVSGLIAAAYLAKSHKKVLLLEAEDRLGGLCAPANLGDGFSAARGAPTLYALDPVVIRDLKFARSGLRFLTRDLAMVGLRSDGKHIVLSRDVHDTAASIAVHSPSDAQAWPRFHKELFEIARAMRPRWWEARGALPMGDACRSLDTIARTSATAWLDSWFESETLKATLCFDATAGSVSSLEPASALSLVWRAAQEMSGLQGAVMIPQGGMTALTEVLVKTATEVGCELRTGVRATRLILDQGRVAGVQTESGSAYFAPVVLSATPRYQTLSELAPREALSIGYGDALERPISPLTEACIVMKLRSAPAFGGIAVPLASRFILAEKPEAYIAAEMTSRGGAIPDEIPMEFVIPTWMDSSLAPPGQHILSVIARPLPLLRFEERAGLKTLVAARVVAALEKFMPGISREISDIEVFSPGVAGYPIRVPSMLADAAHRIETPIEGLFLCGAGAEAVPAISGRAARIAASFAMKGGR
ncbi:MAG TPA: NAD(P)/FAD-dependent oxidoreductase [Rhizomicrobium sp.]|jgi:phytoene dehydrogenase-like protein